MLSNLAFPDDYKGAAMKHILVLARATLFVVIIFVFSFSANAATNSPPVMKGVGLWETNYMEFEITGRPGKQFRLETSSTLTDWDLYEPIDQVSSNFSFVIPVNTGSVFSRVMMMPGTNPPVWSWAWDYPLVCNPSLVTNLILQWNPPNDLLDIAAYRIYQDDILIAELSHTTFMYTVTGLTTGELYQFRIEAGNEDNNWTTNGLTLAVRPAPDNPADIASVLGNGIPTSVGDSIRFLFDSTNSIQTGANTNDLDSRFLSVVHGCVLDESSNMLGGVAITVQGEPDYGTTFTRTNGCYDIAVNGGRHLVFNFRSYGLLPVQRTVYVPWQEGVSIPDVFLLTSDTNLTAVVMTNASTMQVARGPVISDADGTRRAMVMIPTNARASIITYGGDTQEVDQLTTRFTEYTEGTTGPNSMPGDLLPSVAYTYCVELGSVEAQDKVAGRDVLFNTNVYFYTDNFLGIPAGIGVPMGYYDNDRGAWVPSQDGIVIDLLGTNELGLARVCANTNGLESDAAELASLGITDDERLTLAQTYNPATNSLWRVPIQHFSTYDCNYGIVPEDGAEEPQVPPVTGGELIPYPDVNCGNSGIEIENQILTELLPVSGTPYYLVYSTQTASENPKFRQMRIPVSGNTLPTNITGIRLTMNVAGKDYQYDLSAETNQTIDFTWDGTDIYGRSVKGAQPVSYSVEYLYPGYYAMPPQMSASFGASSGNPIAGIRSRAPAVMRQTIKATVGTFDAATRGLGGWMLSVHHVYDPINQRLYLGTGRTRDGVELMRRSSETEWITDILPGSKDSSIHDCANVAVGADGKVYVADSSRCRVACIDRSGDVSILADDFPTYIGHIAVGPDRCVYVTTTTYYGDLQVFRVYPTGKKEVFAGTGGLGPRVPGSKATELNLSCEGLAFAPDGTVFIADMWSNIIWRVGTDGIANIAAGKLAAYGGYDGNGLPAINSKLLYPNGLTYDNKSGRIYICDTGNNLLRAITFGGFLQNVAGNGSQVVDGDGEDALDAGVYEPKSVARGTDGSLFIVHRSSDPGNGRLRQVLPDGRIITIAGEGEETPGMGRLAKRCQFSKEWSIVTGPDGAIYVAADDCIYRFRPATRPIEQSDTLLVASQDASELYVFDLNGRHLQTLDALTGATNLTFSYTTEGFLDSVTDAYGRAMQVHRNGSGLITSVEAPGGQTITFTLDSDDYLATATYPNSGQYQMDYTNTLLSRFERPRGYESTYEYDSSGNLVRYVRVNGTTGTLTRVESSSGWTVIHTNPAGVVQTFETELTDVGGQWSRIRFVCGCGSDKDTFTSPDGLTSNITTEGDISIYQKDADSRFGMQSPRIAWESFSTPGGLLSMVSNTATAVIPDENAPHLFTALTNQTVVNGRTYVSTFDRAQRESTEVSPMGRVFVTRLDANGRLVYSQYGNLAPKVFGYDANGYLSSVTRGTGSLARTTALVNDNNGNVIQSTDPESVVSVFGYNEGNWLTNTLVAGVAETARARDLEGNIVQVKSPLGKVHSFAYSPANLLTRYYTPAVGGVSNLTEWTYTADDKPVSTAYADGSSEEFAYDDAGLLAWHGYNGGGETYTYSAGQLTHIESSNGVTVEMTYDGSLPVTEEWFGPVTGCVTRLCNNDMMPTNILVNGYSIAELAYDLDGFLIQAGEMMLTRDAQNGLVTGTQLGVVEDSFFYNMFGEMTGYVARVNGTNVYMALYERDKLGRITRQIVSDDLTVVTNEYTYDPAGRYLQVITNGTPLRWTFDADGNVTNFARNGTTVLDGECNAQDCLTRWGVDTYGFNRRGVLTNAVLAGVDNRFVYDVPGDLVQVTRTLGGVTNISYESDGKGRRIFRSVNGIRTHGYLYYDDLRPAAVLDGNNQVVGTFVYTFAAGCPGFMMVTGRAYRIISDHIGSPVLVIDTVSGEILQQMSYDTWGVVQSDTHPLFQPFGVAGGLYEPETGFVRFGGRDYDAGIGRWTARDPLLFSDKANNPYAYCQNDPVNRLDVEGAVSEKWVLVIRIKGTVGSVFGGQKKREQIWQSRTINSENGDMIYVGPNSKARIKTADNKIYDIEGGEKGVYRSASEFSEKVDWNEVRRKKWKQVMKNIHDHICNPDLHKEYKREFRPNCILGSRG